MKLIKPLLTVSVLVMLSVLFSSTASAADYPYNISSGNINISSGTGANAGKIAVEQGTTTYITSSDTITITGSTTAYTINVASGVTGVKILLNNVSIDVSAEWFLCAFDIGDGAAVDLTLNSGTINTFKSGNAKAGIKVETPGSGTAGTLTINGAGTLYAVGGAGISNFAAGSGAGIGSNGILYNSAAVPSAGNIIINNGTIYATGGAGTYYSGAGIGGGGGQSYTSGLNIGPNAGITTIHGGAVYATGGSGTFAGAGIGGGSALYSGTMGTLLIDGGTVTAKSGDGSRIANAIGYGYSNSVNSVRGDAASVTITGNAVVSASTSNGNSVYAAIGHNGNQSITISGTATVTATKGISASYSADCGTISCNNLTISDSPSITVYSPNRQGELCSLGNSGSSAKDSIRPIYANSITSSVPIIAGIFPYPPKINTIIMTGGEPAVSKTITLPENYASFAVTVASTGTYSGAMGIDVLQNTATGSQTFDLTNAVSIFNVRQLDITPPAAPGTPTVSAGPDINAQEESSGVEAAVPLGTSGALVNDSVELLLGGQAFSTPVKHVLTTAEITAGSCKLTIPAARLGEDGNKSITARVIDATGNVGPAGGSLTLTLDKTAPAAPTNIQITPIGGVVVSNTLNLTNTNLTATAAIVAKEATGGSATLYINGILKATDNTISAEDTQVSFDLGQSTAAGLQTAVQTGGAVTVELIDFAGNKSVSLVSNPALTVDYTAAGISSVGVPAPDSYKAGRNLDFTVNFSEIVFVTEGTPYIQLALDTGGTVHASYISGSGTSALVFRYTVSDGNTDNNGIQVPAGTVNLNGGKIRDAAGNDANLTLLNVGNTDGIFVDTTAPVVSSVGVPTDKTYRTAQDLDFTVNFSEKVYVTGGAPYIQLTLDTGGTVNAGYVSGSGSSALKFRYTIQSGNLESDGIAVGSDIKLNGSSIQDIAGNSAVLGLSGVGSTSGVKIDAVLPVITSAAVASDNKYIDISFSKGIYGAGALTADKLALSFTPNSGNATNAAISSVKKNDSDAEASASALKGGETTVRVFINITGIPCGLEAIEIKPANASSVYDVLGNAMAAAGTTGALILRDQTPPKVGSIGTISVSDRTSNSAKLTWTAASDAVTTGKNLKYKVVYSTSDITTVDMAEGAKQAKDWTADIETLTVSGLDASTEYYFNVLVKDQAGNKALYTAVTGKTTAPFGGDVTRSSTVIEVNGQQLNTETTTITSADGKKETTITVDEKKLDEILESGGEKLTVTLPSAGSDVTVGELSGQTVKNMENREATLEIKTDTVSYKLNASQINIDAVSSQLGSQVELKDIKVSVKIAEPSADTVKIVEDTANKNSFQLVVRPVGFEITCTSGDKTVEVSKFNSYVERTVAIPDGVDPSKITTGIVLNADGTFSHVPTSIVEIDGKYYARIKSLTNSTYSVIYNPVSFTDVANHWAKDAINDMGSRMVVTGMGNGSYEPDRSITRAEFAAITVRAAGLTKGTTESGFGDVLLADWFNGYVDTATSYALITGYDSVSFGPNDTITREQAMAILARAMKLTGLGASLTDSETADILSKYSDGGGVSGYARTAAALCIKTGIVTGSSATTISPEAYVTRAEVAVMVQRLLAKSGLI